MRKSWSDEEISLLEKHYPLSTKGDLMKLLPGRSAVSIGHKAARLGIKNEARPWSEKELDILRKNYSVLSKEELRILLPKKRWTSIRHKAFELGFKYSLNKYYTRTWKSFDELEMTDVEKGYVAGVIDSDGSISIKLTKDKRTNNTYYAPLVSVYNTDYLMMEKIISILKCGKIYDDRSANYKNPKHKIKYVYNVASIKGVKQVLTQIVPYLTVKKIKAELILELIDIKEKSNSAEPTPRIMEIFKEIRKLNSISNRNIYPNGETGGESI